MMTNYLMMNTSEDLRAFDGHNRGVNVSIASSLILHVSVAKTG